jgi:hypothetical protein
MLAFFRRNRSAQSQDPAKASKSRLRLESLEDRVVPATFTVTNNNDAGAGSLRDAIIRANGTAGEDMITFDTAFFGAGTTINLTSGDLNINDSVTITGAGVANVIINGLGNPAGQRIFTIDSSLNSDDGSAPLNPAGLITVNMSNMTLSGGRHNAAGGGAIFNQSENVNVSVMDFNNNVVAGGDGGAIGTTGGTVTVRQSSFVNNSTNAFGGAIGVRNGTMIIENSTFTQNATTGAAGGGGAIDIFTGANVTLTNNTITNNTTVAATRGGGVLIEAGGSNAVTFSGNIIFGNRSAGAANDLQIDAVNLVSNTSGFNNIGVIAGAGAASPGVQAGVNGNINVNPGLGGLTQLTNGTRALVPAANSLVLDRIPAANAPTVDQAGGSRPAGAQSDIGAVEVGATPVGPGTPVANPDSVTTAPGTAVNINPLANDTGLTQITATTNPSNGSVVQNGNTLTYTPNSGFTGTDTFTYTATDAMGGNAQTATVTVNVQAPPPVQPPTQDLRPIINQLVIANLQAIFAQPIPPGSGIVSARITGLSDANGDGFDDVNAAITLRISPTRVRVFTLTFDGLSPSAAIIGQLAFMDMPG